MKAAHYQDLDTSAVLFEREMNWLVISGPDRVAWLQGMVSNDVGRLGPGEGCAAAHLTPQGKVVALMTVLADPDQLLILSERQSELELARQLDRLLIMEDAAIEDRSDQVHVFSLAGKRASDVLGELLGTPVVLESLYGHVTGGSMRAVRTLWGYDLVVSHNGADRLRAVADSAGVFGGDEELRSIVWVEAGVPRWGVDVTSSVTLPELGEDAIDYSKGCYIGQEVVAKIKYIGRVNRRLTGLRIAGDEVPQAGGIEHKGREVGRLTSAVYSPGAGGVIGLAYIRRGADSPGAEVELVRDGVAYKATVVSLPFIAREF